VAPPSWTGLVSLSGSEKGVGRRGTNTLWSESRVSGGVRCQALTQEEVLMLVIVG
jgi:hypothetical protein